MNKIQKFVIFSLVLPIILLTLIVGRVQAQSAALPTVVLSNTTDVTTTGATLVAVVTSLGNPASISARGTCFGTSPNPVTNCVPAGGTTTGSYSHVRTGLAPATLYYYRGYATNATGTGYSSDGTFTTVSDVPVLSSPTISNLTTSSATLGANVTFLGVPASISERGTCFGTSPSPTTNCIAASGTTTGAYTHARTGFNSNTTYFFRGYAKNSSGTGYSPDGTFTTTTSPPTLSAPTAVPSTNTATLGATITSLGLPASITERGTCFGTTAHPTTNCIAEGGKTLGTYSHVRTQLTPATTYFYRGYAINIIGTGYSPDGTFTTTAVPVLTSPTVTDVTPASATLWATITSLGLPASISERGTCFGTVPNPTTNCEATGGTTTGQYLQARTQLTPGTLYYYRGYATNATGTGYSPDGTFTTVSDIPTVTDPVATAVTEKSVTVGATVSSLGEVEGVQSSITARGICFGTTPSPATNCTAEARAVMGTYTISIIGLNSGTKYFFRGYATNVAGTGYSKDETFTTKEVPSLTHPTVTSINTTSATLGATVVSLGVPGFIIARGTCYGTAPDPTTNCVATDDTTAGAYFQPRTGLTPGTLYYYRGFAANATGKGYSSDGTFTTPTTPPTTNAPTIIDATASAITTTGVTLGANITSLGLPASLSARGICLGTSPAPTTNCTPTSGAATGPFTQLRTGLTQGTTYYYRGYATNATGTAYSSDGVFSTTGTIMITASSISGDGLYSITVYVSNPNPKSLRLKAEYGEGDFGLQTNTFSFDDSGRGTASLAAIGPGETYQYRLFDTTGTLNKSATYSFTTSATTSAGAPAYSSYPVSGSSNGSISTPLPTTPGPTFPTASGPLSSGGNPSDGPGGPVVLGSSPGSSSGSASSTTSTPTGTSSAGGLVPCDNSAATPCDFNAFLALVNKFIQFILYGMAIPIAAVMFFYAGFSMVTSGGSTEARSKAKSVFKNAVIGLAFVAGAWLIIKTILTILGYNGTWIGF